jgi:hypothetical protein
MLRTFQMHFADEIKVLAEDVRSSEAEMAFPGAKEWLAAAEKIVHIPLEHEERVIQLCHSCGNLFYISVTGEKELYVDTSKVEETRPSVLTVAAELKKSGFALEVEGNHSLLCPHTGCRSLFDHQVEGMDVKVQASARKKRGKPAAKKPIVSASVKTVIFQSILSSVPKCRWTTVAQKANAELSISVHEAENFLNHLLDGDFEAG